MQLTVDVPDRHVPFFRELMHHLNFPVIVSQKTTDDEPKSEGLKAETDDA